MDNQNDMLATLKAVSEDYGSLPQYTKEQLASFQKLATVGIPIRSMATFLDMPSDKQDKFLQDLENQRVGIPNVDEEVKDAKGLISSDNEFKRWITHAKQTNKDLQIAIKADKGTEYPVVKKVIDDLREMRENRYLLITSLKTASSN
jgi:biopolymer transport protein ExbD